MCCRRNVFSSGEKALEHLRDESNLCVPPRVRHVSGSDLRIPNVLQEVECHYRECNRRNMSRNCVSVLHLRPRCGLFCELCETCTWRGFLHGGRRLRHVLAKTCRRRDSTCINRRSTRLRFLSLQSVHLW